MTWELSEEQLMIRETVAKAAREKIAPRSREVDETCEFPRDWVDLLRDLGLFGIPFRPEYGGISGSALTLAVAVEELSKVDATAGLILAVQALGGYPLNLAPTQGQKQKRVPPPAARDRLRPDAPAQPRHRAPPPAVKTPGG